MHDADFDHDHEDLYAQASDLEGLEVLTLNSVGIDIGSSTTHLLFSRLTLRHEGGSHSTQFKIASRELVWSSPVMLTPSISHTQIDFEKVRSFIEGSYRAAGFTTSDIDSGAVLITGEALKKENARPISEYFARESGKFICASAGPHHEALLAAYGSGAVHLSKVSRCTVLNVDIGGGTTKFALIRNGEILRTAAISIGARLIAFDREGKITRLEDAGRLLLQKAGLALDIGSALPQSARQAVSALMADTLSDLLRNGPFALARELMITPPIDAVLDDIDYLIFSGGVSEYIYGNSSEAFGDLGPTLGAALKAFQDTLPPGMVQEPAQGIRATVIGASEYTIQVSGTTSFLTNPELLPLHGLKVVRVRQAEDQPFADALTEALQKFDVEVFGPGLLLSLSLDGEMGYDTLHEVGSGIAAMVKTDPASPLVINVEQDVAHALGRMLREEFGLPNPILAIDGVTVGDLDFVDIGEPIAMAAMFPVTVKSLLFAPAQLL
jgi:ethanolamine utilization protein EutA